MRVMRVENPFTSTLVMFGACMLLAWLPGSAAAHSHCDEKRVATLVDRVAAKASRIKKNVAREWDHADKESARYVVLNDLIVLQHQAVALVGLVRAGEGRDKTEPVYRRMQSAVQHARQDADKFPAIAAQRHHIAAAEAALAELADCYGPE